MAWDFLGSDFASRHTQYEKFYGGPPHIMDLYSYFNCPWQERRAAIDQIIKDMGSVDDADKPQRSAAE
jgi:4-hydroxyphenylacetate 3-monooxygenase